MNIKDWSPAAIVTTTMTLAGDEALEREHAEQSARHLKRPSTRLTIGEIALFDISSQSGSADCRVPATRPEITSCAFALLPSTSRT